MLFLAVYEKALVMRITNHPYNIWMIHQGIKSCVSLRFHLFSRYLYMSVVSKTVVCALGKCLEYLDVHPIMTIVFNNTCYSIYVESRKWLLVYQKLVALHQQPAIQVESNQFEIPQGCDLVSCARASRYGDLDTFSVTNQIGHTSILILG